ncbi:MAG: VCBS repeat-containing protein [Niastella sp.]|nr:VCBS repeat-containing protein [Niastella sp.]
MKYFYPEYRGSFVFTTKKMFLLCFSLLAINILVAQPVIQSIAPTFGRIGSTVTITGSNFSPVPTNNIVRFGAVKAVVTAASATLLSVVVPSGASHGPISVTTNNLTGVSAALYRTSFQGNYSEFNAVSFLKETEIATGGYNVAPILMDLDEDGKPDVVAADEVNGGIGVFKNTSANGKLALAERVIVAPGTYASNLFAADIDNDGKPDLIYPYPGSVKQAFAVHRNQSTQAGFAFGAAQDITTPAAIGISFYVGDVNADGKPDVVVGYGYPSTQLSIFKNTSSVGNISFDAPVAIELTQNMANITLQDLNGDNLPEIAATTFAASFIAIFKNTSTNGNIAFAPITKLPANPYSISIASADIDDDGKMDLVVGHTSSQTNVSIFRNNSTSGDISFATKIDYSTGVDPYSFSLNDFDGDGKTDILLCNFSNLNAFMLRNWSSPGSIIFSGHVNYPTVRQARRVASGDLTGDGKPDFLVVREGQQVEIFRNRIAEPVLSAFSPASGGKGSVITITGRDFTGVTSVKFGGTPAASFNVVNATTIEAVLAGGASGDISVTSNSGTGKIPAFLFIPPPTIVSISDSIGTKGSTIIIDGKNFSNATAVSFGGTAVNSFTVVSDTRISAVLGAGASGNIEVTTPAGQGLLAAGFAYIPETTPHIISFTPETATGGQVVTINGFNFTGATAVSFGDIAATTFTVVSASKIVATVGTGNSGAIKVITATGAATKSGFTYGTTPVPSITSFSPLSAKAGQQVTIQGTNFSSITSNNRVTFGTVNGKVISASPTSLTVIVPSGASYYPIQLTTNGYSAQSRLPFTLTFESGGLGVKPQDFKSTWIASVAYSPDHAQTHDLDGDQKPDIAILNDGMYADLYRNTSTEQGVSFAARRRLQVSNNTSLPIRMRINDLNNDGRPDLIVSNQWTDVIVTMKNNSTPGTFSFDYPQLVSPTYVGRGFTHITVNDIDMDGKADLVASDNHPSSIFIYRNTSSADVIQFAGGIDMNVGRYVAATFLEDIDEDGKPDLILSSDVSSIISIRRNISSPGNIQFAPPVELDVVNAAYNVFIADFDGDGKLDLSNSFSFLRNTSSPGSISFAARQDLPEGDRFKTIGVADLDGDGKVDLACQLSDIHIGVMKNNSTAGNISFSQAGTYTTQAGPYLAGICDYDGDGKPDMASVNSNASYSQLLIFKNAIGEAVVTPSGANPVTGAIVQKTYFDETVQTYNGNPYVQRHYDINPVNNPMTATATLTLYYLQSEFDNYNAHPAHGLPLPTNPNDQTGKENLRIYQYHGFSASGLPGSYTGETVEINPDNDKIVWNATFQRWEVTFNIIGFSGFFAGSEAASLLPVHLVSFSGKARSADIVLQWSTGFESNVSRFEIKRSSNSTDFKTLGTVAATNEPNGSSYSFIDANPLNGNNFYRLSMVDLDGSRNESKIILINLNKGAHVVSSLAPNPTKGNATLKVEGVLQGMVSLSLYDYGGKLLFARTVSANNSASLTVEIPAGNYPKGAYVLHVKVNGQVITHKIVVQ